MDPFSFNNETISISKAALGLLATLLTILISSRKTYVFYKQPLIVPQPITWLLLAVTGGFSTAVMIKSGAGLAAMVLVVTTVFNMTNCIIGFRKGGKRQYTKFTWGCVMFTIIAGVLWRLTSDPLIAAICITLASVIAFGPTIEKAKNKPYSENPGTYWANAWRYLCATLAVADYSWSASLYTGTWVMMNLFIYCYLRLRTRHLDRTSYGDEATHELIQHKINLVRGAHNNGKANDRVEVALTHWEAAYIKRVPNALVGMGDRRGLNDDAWHIEAVLGVRMPYLVLKHWHLYWMEMEAQVARRYSYMG